MRGYGSRLHLSLIPGLAAVLLLGACSAPRARRASWAAERSTTGYAKDEDRMLIKRASLKIATSEIGEAAEKAVQIATAAGGYVENSSLTEGQRATIRLRVPSAQLEEILDLLAELGSEEQREVSGKDVTDQVLDLEAVLKTKIALRDRLRKLLDRAVTVAEVIQVEQELTRLQGEIDSMQARLDRLKGDVALASVSLTIGKKRILGPLGYIGAGFWWLLSKLFVIQ